MRHPLVILAWANVVLHVGALVGAAVGMRPGSPLVPLDERLEYLAAAPLAWTLAWIAWMLCALALIAFLAAVTARLATLTEQSPHLALEAVTGADGAQQRYVASQSEAETITRELSQLQAALSVAQSKLAAEQRARQLAEQAEQRERVSKILAQREGAARECSEHLAAAIESFRQLIDYSAKAFTAFPGGAPMGAVLRSNEITSQVALEIFRLNGVPYGASGFPGAGQPEIFLAGQPEKVPSLLSKIAEANKFLRDVLDGKLQRAERALP